MSLRTEKMWPVVVAIVFLVAFVPGVCSAEPVVRIAVASNFSQTMKALSQDFKNKHDIDLLLSQASTGKIYAQILHGAPYDAFFSADEKRADLLLEKKLAHSGYVYAQGQLVFITGNQNKAGCYSSLDSMVKQYAARKISIANPKTAPYGLAAKQTLQAMGQWNKIKQNLVMGENVLQAMQFISSGGVGAGFVAESLIVNIKNSNNYCQWSVPLSLYHPVKQKMVVLNKAKNKLAVDAFVNYIKTDAAKNIIRKNGYLVK